MQPIRSFLAGHVRLAALILVMALAMKALVPAGYMVGAGTGQTLTIEICDGQGKSTLRQISVAGKHMQTDESHEKAAKECPFTAISMHSLAASDAALLALAIAFILALGFAPVPVLRLQRRAWLSPPLRGPPALS